MSARVAAAGGRARRAATLLATLALAAHPLGVRADDSVFGIRGLGLLGRPLGTRAAATGGAFALFDATSVTNPAALGGWRVLSAWAVSASSSRDVNTAAGDVGLRAVRFPVFGFASPVGSRWVLSVSAADFLNRNWGVWTTRTDTLRGSAVVVDDTAQSVGGVSDLRVGAAYRLSARVLVGVAFHALSGSARQTIERTFSDTAYQRFSDDALTSFSGVGASVGLSAWASRRLQLAATIRLNGRLTAQPENGTRSRVALPAELAAAATYELAPGLQAAATASWAGWSAADQDLRRQGLGAAHDTWAVAAGLEAATVRAGAARLPLRLGWRWRQLPFPAGSDEVTESALSGGTGLVLVGGRAEVEVAIERGSRRAGAVREAFTTAYVGLVVRP